MTYPFIRLIQAKPKDIEPPGEIHDNNVEALDVSDGHDPEPHDDNLEPPDALNVLPKHDDDVEIPDAIVEEKETEKVEYFALGAERNHWIFLLLWPMDDPPNIPGFGVETCNINIRFYIFVMKCKRLDLCL